MKILLVEDEQDISEWLSAVLTAHGYVVDGVTDGLTGLEIATQWPYDLIILDILLPALNGIEVCRRLRSHGCQTPILILTVKDSNKDIIDGLDSGADDYLAKSCDSSQLLARVRALLRRSGTPSLPPVLTWGLLVLNPSLAQVTYNQQAVSLRPKEYSLLELFLRHPRRIFSRSAIIDHLWSMEDAPVEGSVTTLIKDLRQRLKAAGMETDLIETVYGLGYRLKVAPQSDREALAAPSADAPRAAPSRQPTGVGSLKRTWPLKEARGSARLQNVSERFRVSLERRIATLEATVQSLQTGKLSLQHQQAARTEAHKLAGGLGTFGYEEASEVAAAIEHFLTDPLGPKPSSATQLCQLLADLRQALAQPLTEARIVQPNPVEVN